MREKTLFSIEKIKQVLDDDTVKPLLHKTTRKFEGYSEFCYYSLKLRNVSVESLIWIIKSISRDFMKPNESLVHSRYKECFDLQIRKEWKNFIVQICKN